MKKILFLLLCTVSIYGQTGTGQEHDMDYGLRIPIDTLQTVTTPSYLSTFGNTGVFGKIPSAYIAKTAAVQDSLNKKLNLPTGFLQGLQLSINADPTKFNIAAGYYVVTDFSDLAQPVVKIINYAGSTGLTPAYLATANSTYVALDKNQNVISSASPFTDAQRRTLAIIGNVVHSNNTTINVTNEIKAPIVAFGNQLHDFMRAIGFLNESGNIYSANGANLQINKSVGDIFGMGINAADYLSPHKLTIPSQTALTFAYRFQNGTQLADTQNINPNIYDVAGVSTPTPSNKWTIQRINLFQSGLSRIQPGQTVYNSFIDATTALPTQPFVTEQNIADNAVFRCYLIVQEGTTNLASAVAGGTAQFVPVDKFGNIIGNGSVALTYSNIIAALGFTPANDADVVHKIGNETVSGIKNFTDKVNVNGLQTLYVPNQTNFDGSLIIGTGGLNLTNSAPNPIIAPGSSGVNNGKQNTFIGISSGQENTSGNQNTFVGTWSGVKNTIGDQNTFIGMNSGWQNTTGYHSTYVGAWAGQANTTGYRNAFFGTDTGNYNISGSENSYFGNGAGAFGTTGNSNSFFGTQAGINSNSTNNSFFGRSAGFTNTSGANNSFFGMNTGYFNTTGYDNVFLGQEASLNNTTGYRNVSIGKGSSFNTTTGNFNVSIGAYAGADVTTGSSNVFIGNGSGGIGQKVDAINSIAIGKESFTTKDNQIVLGNSSITETLLNGVAKFGNTTKNITTTGISFGTDKGNIEFIGSIFGNGFGNKIYQNGERALSIAGRANSLTWTDNLTITDQGLISVGVTPTTSAGTYDILTRNTSTGVVEKILSNTLATVASPTLTGTPTAPTATAGTNTTQIATTAFVQGTRPYKVYTALLSQIGTSAPTVTVLENTFGGTVVWTRTGVGAYLATLSGVFTANKTSVLVTPTSGSTIASASSSSVNDVNLSTALSTTAAAIDGVLSNATIEIRVYN